MVGRVLLERLLPALLSAVATSGADADTRFQLPEGHERSAGAAAGPQRRWYRSPQFCISSMRRLFLNIPR